MHFVEAKMIKWQNEKSTCALSGKTVLWNTDVSTPPGAIVKVFTESGGRCLFMTKYDSMDEKLFRHIKYR